MGKAIAREQVDADLLATRRAWLALDGWELVKVVPLVVLDAPTVYAQVEGGAYVPKGRAHTVMRRQDDWRCTCADFVLRERKLGGVCKHIRGEGGERSIPRFRVSRQEPSLVWDSEKDSLEGLLEASTTQRGVLWIPECWDWLLEGEMPTPSSPGPSRSPDDPSAYRGDFRQTRVRGVQPLGSKRLGGGYEVEARLRSGPTNYWIDWVVRQGTQLLYEGTADGRSTEVDFEVAVDELKFQLGVVTLSVPVKRYRTERPPRKRSR
jgi:hypothetical protein